MTAFQTFTQKRANEIMSANLYMARNAIMGNRPDMARSYGITIAHFGLMLLEPNVTRRVVDGSISSDDIVEVS